MADSIIRIGENSPEFIGYKLMHDVAAIEDGVRRDRKWLLDTYAECLSAVRDPHKRGNSNRPSQSRVLPDLGR